MNVALDLNLEPEVKPHGCNWAPYKVYCKRTPEGTFRGKSYCRMHLESVLVQARLNGISSWTLEDYHIDE